MMMRILPLPETHPGSRLIPALFPHDRPEVIDVERVGEWMAIPAWHWDFSWPFFDQRTYNYLPGGFPYCTEICAGLTRG